MFGDISLTLFINSIYAIKENKNITEGKLTIKTYEDGDYVVCIVADNGIGIEKDKQLKIFEPFFTTKPVGAGTGLGLSLAYDIIIKKHKGSISVESEPNLGTKFTIRLPISKLK